MLRNACLVCDGNMSDDNITYMAKNFDFFLGPGKIAHAIDPKKKAFAYAQPLERENTWTEWLDKFGWKKWIQQEENDGLLVDTPFEHYDIQRLDEVAQMIAPYPVCPNYGDLRTWTRTSPAAPGYGPMSAELEQHFTWAWVQNALDMRFFTPKLWSEVRGAANLRLAAGRTLILGIYDPGRKNEQLCALLTQSFEHPRLYWNYVDSMTSADPRSNWNEEWKWCR